MLNINESMWRDSASGASMTKAGTNAWGTTDMALQSRRSQFSSGSSSSNNETGSGVNSNGGSVSGNNAVAGSDPRLKFMFSPEDMTETVLFGGPASQKIGTGLEDAMERLSMVSLDLWQSLYSSLFLLHR